MKFKIGRILCWNLHLGLATYRFYCDRLIENITIQIYQLVHTMFNMNSILQLESFVNLLQPKGNYNFIWKINLN